MSTTNGLVRMLPPRARLGMAGLPFSCAPSLNRPANIRCGNAIKTLYDEMKTAIQETTRSHTENLLDAIFSKPIFRTSILMQQLAADHGIHDKTAPRCCGSCAMPAFCASCSPAVRCRRAATLCFPA